MTASLTVRSLGVGQSLVRSEQRCALRPVCGGDEGDPQVDHGGRGGSLWMRVVHSWARRMSERRVLSLSGEEEAILAAMEAALCEEDPELVRTLARFTRPRRHCWLWGVLVGLLVLVPLSLILGIALHSMVFNIAGAVLAGALLTTAAVLSGGVF